MCPQHDATVRTREEAEEAERLAGEKVVRSVEAARPCSVRWRGKPRRRRRCIRGKTCAWCRSPARTRARARTAGGRVRSDTNRAPAPLPEPQPRPVISDHPPLLSLAPPPPPPPLPPTDAAGRFFLPRRRAAVSHAAACEAERGQGVPTAGRAARGRTVAAGRVACSRRGGRDETPSGSTTN